MLFGDLADKYIKYDSVLLIQGSSIKHMFLLSKLHRPFGVVKKMEYKFSSERFG